MGEAFTALAFYIVCIAAIGLGIGLFLGAVVWGFRFVVGL